MRIVVLLALSVPHWLYAICAMVTELSVSVNYYNVSMFRVSFGLSVCVCVCVG